MRKDIMDPLATCFSNITVYRNLLSKALKISSWIDLLITLVVIIRIVLGSEGVWVIINSLNSLASEYQVLSESIIHIISYPSFSLRSWHRSTLYKYDKLEMENCWVWIKSRKISFYVNNHQPIYQSGFGPKSRR